MAPTTDNISSREFQNFREDIHEQLEEIKKCFTEQTQELKAYLDERLDERLEPYNDDLKKRQESETEKKRNKHDVRLGLLAFGTSLIVAAFTVGFEIFFKK